jgi:hypothetical protein
MQIAVSELGIYHEAGHAAVFRHYGIPIQSVITTPDLEHRYGGMVIPACEPPVTGRVALENWMRALAAGQAAADHRYWLMYPCMPHEPEPEVLMAEFESAARQIADHPNPPRQDDVLNFASLGINRDREIRDCDSDSRTGPVTWVAVWLEAIELVRSDEIWRVVQVVARDLMADLRDLTGEEYEALAAKAAGGQPQQ